MATADRICRYDFVIEDGNPQCIEPYGGGSARAGLSPGRYTACTTVGKPMRRRSS
jgi:hypothetical protein